MRKIIGVLLLVTSMLATGCGDRSQDKSNAQEVAVKFDKAALDYLNRAEGEDLQGTEYATEKGQKMMKEGLLGYDDYVHNVRGRQGLPEVKDVVINDVFEIGADHQDGYIVNTTVVYNPDRSLYYRHVGLKLISVDGTWKVDEVDFQGHFESPKND
ncbi:hypothetical protein CIG75_16295 [Tumebacillus algifaecis]|uniref:DUF4829 domain-containing protein n=1 Tax=Tumebacillus algifaecis TaxID=1214604 RepID=A0A223D4J7_9BACL|nr:hypothetical protein [Tumebacillus algifaecis]ASS76356.1 hypothetical protein CIG75_16295 [Tumebacillus algifaecis]